MCQHVGVSDRPLPSISEDKAVGDEPKVDKRVRRRKPGKLFFITLSFSESPSTVVRQQFLINLQLEEVVSYLISLEKNKKSEECEYHLHAFIEFRDKVYIENVREYIVAIYNNCRIDVQPVRSKLFLGLRIV